MTGSVYMYIVEPDSPHFFIYIYLRNQLLFFRYDVSIGISPGFVTKLLCYMLFSSATCSHLPAFSVKFAQTSRLNLSLHMANGFFALRNYFIFHHAHPLSLPLSRISWPFRLLRLWQWTRLVCQCARLKEKALAADTSYSARSFPNPSRDFCFVTDCINGRRHWWICFLARNSFCLFTPKPHTSIRNLAWWKPVPFGPFFKYCCSSNTRLLMSSGDIGMWNSN